LTQAAAVGFSKALVTFPAGLNEGSREDASWLQRQAS
jgi:hypothetical protein